MGQSVQTTGTLLRESNGRVSIPSPRNTSVSAARAINVALGLADQQKHRLCAIVESKQATPDEKFQAPIDLAHLAEIVLHSAAEGEAEIFRRSSTDQKQPLNEKSSDYCGDVVDNEYV